MRDLPGSQKIQTPLTTPPALLNDSDQSKTSQSLETTYPDKYRNFDTPAFERIVVPISNKNYGHHVKSKLTVFDHENSSKK